MRYITIVFCVFVQLLSVNIGHPTIIHVPADSSTIQTGINGAMDGDTVLVAEGLYVEQVNFNGKKILVTSQYMNDGDSLHIKNTVIHGNHAGTVVSFVTREDWHSVIQAFTIENGSANRGGGVVCDSSSPLISHCIITNNTAEGGGGIFCSQASPTIEYCQIVNNQARVIMPGEYGVTTMMSVMVPPGKGCGGGILCVTSSNTTVSGCTIAGNSAFVSFVGGTGGGIGCIQSTAVISFCAIYGNSANTWAGGILCSSSLLTVLNCTIANNSADDGGGIFSAECDISSEVKNSILWANQPDQIYLYSAPILLVNYCDAEDGWPLGTENLNCCPEFCNPYADNYSLAESSCCVGAGQGGVNIGAFGVGCPGYVRGDANGDGKIDIGDVIYLINYLFKTGPEPCVWETADVNDDNQIDIGDVVYLINYLFKSGPSPSF